MSNNKNNSLETYGVNGSATYIMDFLKHIAYANLQLEKEDKKKGVLCVWGPHGIGKTTVVGDFAKNNGFKYVEVAPAQFEEMGDLIGMPTSAVFMNKEGCEGQWVSLKIKDDFQSDGWIMDMAMGEKTKFNAPDWVPTEEGPGIILFDDFNRADARIINGVMQLLQNGELISWKLPKGWMIVLTANPDGGDYSITTIDDAQITRMIHITQKFEKKAWAKWADAYGVDTRGINFVLTNPEIIDGGRTTPRTLVQFFDQIRFIPNLQKDMGKVNMLAKGCLSDAAADAFAGFINEGMEQLPDPEDILNVDPKLFKATIEKTLKRMAVSVGKNGAPTVRAGLLSTICTRVYNWAVRNHKDISKKSMTNLKNFLIMDFLPNDLRVRVVKDFVSCKDDNGREITKLADILADPEVGNLVLDKM